MSSLTSVATNLIDTLGLAGVSVGLLVNCMGIPISSEIIIPLAGIGIKQGHFNLVVALAVTIVAQLIGLFLSYAIGRYGGVGLIQKYGKYLFISKHELNRAELAFEKYGGRLVFFGLCLPGVHGYVGLAAAAGATIWSAVLLAFGYFLGDHLSQIDAIFNKFGIVVAVVFIGAAIWYIMRHKKREESL
jgi:membrane protein DedA with SNARE-associated domain